MNAIYFVPDGFVLDVSLCMPVTADETMALETMSEIPDEAVEELVFLLSEDVFDEETTGLLDETGLLDATFDEASDLLLFESKLLISDETLSDITVSLLVLLIDEISLNTAEDEA